MRDLVPADTLVYLETNDLAAALQPIVDSKPFTDVAKSKPDFSVLKGVQLAVAVTGFELSEEKLTDENSIGRIQPKFVAIADTHAWNYQAVAFADHKLGQFVTEIYGDDVTQDRADKDGGQYFTWTAPDGRKSHAFVTGSQIWFSNDETTIEQSVAVYRGGAESLAKSGRVPPPDPTLLAAGYITTDGISQIASIVGVRFAAVSPGDAEVKSFVVDVIPNMIRDSITDLRWSARASNGRIEDHFIAGLGPTRDEKSHEVLAEIGNSTLEEIESVSGDEIVRVLSTPASDEGSETPNVIYSREDRSTSTRAERIVVSDLGFLGWIVAELQPD